MSTNVRRAPRQIMRAVKHRLAKVNPGANLVAESVRLARIPGTHYEATIFLFESKGKVVFVAELLRSGLPHIYQSHLVTRDARRNLENLGVALLTLSKTVISDPRFGRNIISLNGSR
jgi:hypothetical protein